MSEAKETNTIKIGDTYYDEDTISPSTYFDYVKGMKKNLKFEEYDIIIDTALKMLEKTKKTGQTAMAASLTHQLELAMKEVAAAKDGFDIFVDRKDIERYITDVEGKSIKIIDLEKYERDIPDEVLDKLEKAREHFDMIYIIFTDYTSKTTKKVAKERRDKDPVMFGAFRNEENDNIYIEDRLFFIADWVEPQCELTLEEIVRDIEKKDKKTITYRISTPESEEEVKKIFSTIKSKDMEQSEMEPVTIFEKVKRRIIRKKTENGEEKPKKRGRKKKTEEA